MNVNRNRNRPTSNQVRITKTSMSIWLDMRPLWKRLNGLKRTKAMALVRQSRLYEGISRFESTIDVIVLQCPVPIREICERLRIFRPTYKRKRSRKWWTRRQHRSLSMQKARAHAQRPINYTRNSTHDSSATVFPIHFDYVNWCLWRDVQGRACDYNCLNFVTENKIKSPNSFSLFLITIN